MPIPAEQLYTPVRVCDACYDELTADRQSWSDQKIREFEKACESAAQKAREAVADRSSMMLLKTREPEDSVPPVTTTDKSGPTDQLYCDKIDKINHSAEAVAVESAS